MSEASFTDKMQALVAFELSRAHSDPERMGEAIERLTNSLALTIATACKGHPTATNNMVEGVCAHLFERVVDHARLAQFLAGARS